MMYNKKYGNWKAGCEASKKPCIMCNKNNINSEPYTGFRWKNSKHN